MKPQYSWLAAVLSITLAGFASDLLPVIALLLTLGITFYLTLSWMKTVNVQKLHLVPLPFLIVASLGLIYAFVRWDGNHLFEAVYQLDVVDLILRFGIVFACVLFLSAFCPSPRLAGGLALWGVAGPLLIWLIPAQLTAGNAEQRGGIIVVYVGLMLMWWLSLEQYGLLAKIRDWIRQRMMETVSSVENNTQWDEFLAWIEGWLDPRKESEKYIRVLVIAKTDADREKALEHILQWMRNHSRLLPPASRQRLEELSERPEAQLILAEDDLLRRQGVSGWLRVAHLMDEADLEWPHIWTFWAEHTPIPDREQLALWEVAQNTPDEQPFVLTLLGLMALEHTLAAALLEKIEQEENPEAHFIRACYTVHESSTLIPDLVEYVPILSEMAIHDKFLPALSEAARKNPPPYHFFYHDNHPQLLEVQTRPLTSIYGGRIAVWQFAPYLGVAQVGEQTISISAGAPSRLAFTGHGPSAVCSRVSALICDLARERECESDVILAGASFFDLTVPNAGQKMRWNPEQIGKRVGELAHQLRVENILSLESAQDQLKNIFKSTRRVDNNLINQDLNQLAQEKGFLKFQFTLPESWLQQAYRAFAEQTALSTPSSFPVLMDFKHRGAPLTVHIPRLFLGIDGYEQTVKEYTRSVSEEMRKEWARRIAKYSEWASQYAREYHRYEREIEEDGESALLRQQVNIHYQVNMATAMENRLDTPVQTNALERYHKLPEMILDTLGFQAWAEERLKAISLEDETQPHWMQTCLVDAFLRGWPLPSEDTFVNDTRDKWQEQWRPLALAALDASLRRKGLSLASIAVENVVFYKVEDDGDDLMLRVGYIWDPANDPVPALNNGTTCFTSGFRQRKRTFTPSPTAQQQALEILQKGLAGRSINHEQLRWALGIDSGAGLDYLLQELAGWFVKADLELDIQHALEKAAQKMDPVAQFEKSLGSYYPGAKIEECEKLAKRHPAFPDFWAWQLYFCGQLLVGIAEKRISHPPYAFSGMHQEVPAWTHDMAASRPWKVIKHILNGQYPAHQIKDMAEEAGYYKDIVSIIKNAAAKLSKPYLKQCLDASDTPPKSRERQEFQDSEALSFWEQACLDIAEGDAAFQLVQILAEGTAHLTRENLVQCIQAVKHFTLRPLFEHLIHRRTSILEELEKFRQADDRVSLHHAKEAIYRAIRDLIPMAESSYEKAALKDGQYGCGWLRLARLKWETARYREALNILVGPMPKGNLSSCQLPFALAIKRLGGKYKVTCNDKQPFTPQAIKVQCHASDENTFVLDFVREDEVENLTRIGSCTVRGLAQPDRKLLSEFFERYPAEQFASKGTATFEEWLSFIQIPNLGNRGALAQALASEGEFALLAAGVYLGASDVLRAKQSSSYNRPAEWLSAEVITQIQ